MSHLPRICRLEVSGYEMYPGTESEPGLPHAFAPGLTLVVGANGLGKTTLVTLLRHMCVGPSRLRNRGGGTFDAGGLSTTPIEGDTFADRVGDRARSASAQLSMQIGESSIEVARSLANLRLESLVVDGAAHEPSEEAFRSHIVEAAEISDYADWVLLIDYLMFVTEERAEPFWDANVQRQLLRVLTRDVPEAAELSAAERRHIGADSDFRNARVQLNRHRQRFEAQVAKVQGSGDINDEILRLSGARDEIDVEIAGLERQVEGVQKRHTDALRDEEAVSAQLQLTRDEFEVARLAHIEAAMPRQDEVVRYLSARLTTSQTCPWCGKDGGDIESRLASGVCFFCGLPDSPAGDNGSPDLAALESRVRQAEAEVMANAASESERSAQLRSLEGVLAKRRSERGELDTRIKALRSQLPKGEADLGSSAAFLADLESDLDQLRDKLDDSRAHFQQLLEIGNEAVRARQGDIKSVFDRVATTFLVEKCQLVPHETSVRIGQEGGQFEVQGFDLELGSATKVGPRQRDSRESVSESQRVFVDVAFRIALIDACVKSGAGSLVVDAPEGSLDTVFSSNAATLLFTFVQGRSDRVLVVATNLVDGSMLPRLVELGEISSANDPRLINLLDVAAPTAAVRERGDEYRAALTNALGDTPAGEQQ